MATIGIDFGASRLRIAGDQDGSPILVDHPYARRRMPFVVSCERKPDRAGPAVCRISSLKHMLDFEQALPVPPSGKNSLDCLAEIFKTVRDQCFAASDEESVNCVVAVAPSFSQRQRSALRAATRKAGFTRVKLVDETLAMLLASRQQVADCPHILVYSLGAGTFSASLYRTGSKAFEVVAQDGDRSLGGDDIDSALATAVLEKLLKMAPALAPGRDGRLLTSIASVVQRASCAVAAGESVKVPVKGILTDAGTTAPRRRTIAITPQMHEKALSPMIAETLERSEKLLAGNEQAKPDLALISGGIALIPRIRKLLAKRLGLACEPADENAIALGAVLYGMSLDEAVWAEAGSRPSGRSKRRAPVVSAPSAPQPTSRGDAGRDAQRQYRPPKRWADTYTPLLDTAQQQDSRGNPTQAIETLDRLLGDLSRLQGELCRKAASREKASSNTEETLKLLRRAHQFDPDNRFIIVDFARACYEQGVVTNSGGRQEEALQVTGDGVDAIKAVQEKSKECDVTLARLLHLQGRILCDLGRLGEAEKKITQSAKLDPERSSYHEDLKRIRSSLKQAPGKAMAAQEMKGRARNKPCPCGSGKKWKHCCGS
ncbi:MAG: Hsp70 family protein [Phycisphaerae bacterium]|nr:Hsp70 family protein [Phycisphaerae bacterium]